ncbi:tagaturonate reductase [Arcticibacter sp.]|uniref:tagaturonate reductase n=1 Tax=Arcticibacter sp. TaxID=1872630 RepID=UPI00388D587A
MARLNKDLINKNRIAGFLENWDKLPEKVLQFGTGALLRGLPDYFIDKANRQSEFNGRIVVVKSTDQGGTDEFAAQDCLYTLHVKGIQNGKEAEESVLISAISRVLSAANQWEAILGVATQPHLEIIISNTTEIGIVLDEKDDLNAFPPASFPAKLTALLYTRFLHFRGDRTKGLIILPTELLSDNGAKLKEMVIKLAYIKSLPEEFVEWLKEANHFCNTLVDRIVPGRIAVTERAEIEQRLGYTDELAILAEPFRLWAIESSSKEVVNSLSFAKVDDGVIIVPDIWKFKELKLRLLNGSHSFGCGLAMLCGFDTVRDAMQNAHFSKYIFSLLKEEIVFTIANEHISEAEAMQFASAVMDRFGNPFLHHKWMSISLNYTSKMQMRNVPLIEGYVHKTHRAPKYMALGFSAYILSMKDPGNLDEHAGAFADLWKEDSSKLIVDAVLGNVGFWRTDLRLLKRFGALVEHYLTLLRNGNALEVIKALNSNNNN